MKNRYLEKLAAILCALCLAVAVMSGTVFARDEETPAAEIAEPEATFVVLDASSTELSVGSDEVIDNRTEIPCYAGEDRLCVCRLLEGVPYMSVRTFCEAVGLGSAVRDDGRTLAISSDGLELQCSTGENVVICNGRYLYAEQGVLSEDGGIYLPVEILVKCVGIGAEWNRAAWRITLYPETVCYLESGDIFYDETDVYWLSRLIYASAGDRSMEAQIGVGSVVMNRISDPAYDGQDTVYDVIFAKNQFDVVINGMIYMMPDEAATAAAKIALEGCDVVDGATGFSTDEVPEGQAMLTVLDGLMFTSVLEAQS